MIGETDETVLRVLTLPSNRDRMSRARGRRTIEDRARDSLRHRTLCASSAALVRRAAMAEVVEGPVAELKNVCCTSTTRLAFRDRPRD